MVSKMKRMWASIDLEERILNGGILVALIALFLPWISGAWPGSDEAAYTGFQFYTSFLGFAVCILLIISLLIVLVPLLGGPILLRRRHRDLVRLILTSQANVLLLASLTVLTKVTYEYSRLEIRFGIYLAITGSIVASIYSFLRWQEFRKNETHDLFHHPEDMQSAPERQESRIPTPPPPPPPAPLQPEEHHMHR